MKPEHAMARHSLAHSPKPSDKEGKKSHPSGEGESHGPISHMTVHPAKHAGGEGFVIHHHSPEKPQPETHMAPDVESLAEHMKEHAPMMHEAEPTEMAGGEPGGANISG